MTFYSDITEKQTILRQYNANNANKLNNLEEIDKFLETNNKKKFLETYNLFRLYQEEIKNLDKLTTSNKIESVTKKELPPTKSRTRQIHRGIQPNI